MQNLNELYRDGLRTEIAILQEDVDAKCPGVAKFTIPVLMTESKVTTFVGYNNIINNNRNANILNSSINLNNSIDLFIPTEYTYFCGKDIVPKGTRFIVSFISSNINDIRIIGRYDYLEIGGDTNV